MASLVADCPRCAAQRTTFDICGEPISAGARYDWQHWFEVFAVCRHCLRATIFLLSEKSLEVSRRGGADLIKGDLNLNKFFDVQDYISLKNEAAQNPPEHVPEDVAKAFGEAATCMSTQCWNAAGAMFRAAMDIATRSMLPEPPKDGEKDADGLNWRARRDLGLRLPWLFANGRLPPDLERLSRCVREDANDGVHSALLTKADAEDLLDFTVAILERIYTEPKRLELAEKRREDRRQLKTEA